MENEDEKMIGTAIVEVLTTLVKSLLEPVLDRVNEVIATVIGAETRISELEATVVTNADLEETISATLGEQVVDDQTEVIKIMQEEIAGLSLEGDSLRAVLRTMAETILDSI